MTLRVIGAGVGRTGTMSLKLALEKLLGGPCYHMIEVFPRPEHIRAWHSALDGDPPNWDELYDVHRSGRLADVHVLAGAERDVSGRIPSDRLIEWQPGDGWAPICERLGIDAPAEPFPHTNTTEEFRGRAGWD